MVNTGTGICFDSIFFLYLILTFFLDEFCRSPSKERSRATLTPIDLVSGWSRPESSSDLQVWSNWESNEGSEPQLTLQEEVFTFASQPHFAKRGQGQGDRERMEMGDDQVQSRSDTRYGAQPEDDFIGSESDEVRLLFGLGTNTFHFKYTSL